jgi:hypothetical protein
VSDRGVLAAYLATTWTVESPGGPLRVRPGEPAPPALRPSAVVTAYNPASHRRSADENRRADEALRARIAARGHAPRRTLARGNDDPSCAWDEPGWCIAGEVRDDAVRLGAEFGQNAIVWVDAAGAVSILCTRDGFCGARVGEVLG